MKKKICPVVVFLVILVALGFGSAFSATIEVRALDGSNEIHVDPDTDFQVEVFIELTAEEGVKE